MEGYNIYQRIQKDIGDGNIFSLTRAKLEEYVAALCRPQAYTHFGKSQFQGVFETVRMALTAKISEEPILHANKERHESQSKEVSNMPSSDILLFISHSSRDVVLVEALIDLIRIAFNIDSSKIRCTSVDGYRLSGGANTIEQLKKEVHDATAFIGVISAESIKSVYVVFELGARWGADRSLIPIIAPGASPGLLGGPLSGINALDSTNRSQLIQLLDDLSRELSIPLQPAPSYQRKVDAILNLPSLGPNSPTIEVDSSLTQNNYELVKTEGGAVVYKSKTEPIHFACPNCWKNEISILQDRRVVAGVFDCPSCNNSYPVNPMKKVGRRVISKGIEN